MVMAAIPVIYTQAADTLTVTLMGDILLDRGVRRAIERKGMEHLFSASVDSVFRHSDVVVGNLECPATKIKGYTNKKFVFRGEPEWLAVLKRHGVTHLNLANNHSVDQGREGLADTKRNVERAGMVSIGAGSSMEEAVRPVLIADKPRKVYVVASLRLALENHAYLPAKTSVSQTSMDSLLHGIRQLRASEPHAFIIVCLHWGVEHRLKPTFQQVKEAHDIMDAGADCIVGHHSHTLQSIEDYRGKKIYYSIGNFIFDQQKTINTQACMVRIKVAETSAALETIPVEIVKCVPHVRR